MQGSAQAAADSMIKRTALLAWLTLWALVCVVSAQDKNLALVDQYSMLSGHLEKAKRALQHTDLLKCEREALYCLERLPQHHEAHFLLSQILYKRGEFDKSLEHILAARKGYLELSEALSLLRQQKMTKRLDDVAGLIDDVRDSTAAEDAAKSRGTCSVNRYSRAVEDAKDKLSNEKKLDEAGEGDQGLAIPADYSYLHGNCLFRLRRLPEAEAEYRLAIRSDPGHAGAYNNLINLLFIEKRLEEARILLAEAEAHKAAVNPNLKKAVAEKSRR